MSMQAGVMKMRAVPKIDLPAGKTVELKPGGYHLMLMNLERPLRDGETVPVTLVFEGPDKKREEIRVNARVRDVRADMHNDMKRGH
jgi:copper(I)-binding protein